MLKFDKILKFNWKNKSFVLFVSPLIFFSSSCISTVSRVAHLQNSFQGGKTLGKNKYEFQTAITTTPFFRTNIDKPLLIVDTVYYYNTNIKPVIKFEALVGIIGASYGITQITDMGFILFYGYALDKNENNLYFPIESFSLGYGGKIFIKQSLLDTPEFFSCSIMPSLLYSVGNTENQTSEVSLNSNLLSIGCEIPMSYNLTKNTDLIFSLKYYYQKVITNEEINTLFEKTKKDDTFLFQSYGISLGLKAYIFCIEFSLLNIKDRVITPSLGLGLNF